MNFVLSVGNYDPHIERCVDLLCHSLGLFSTEPFVVWLGLPNGLEVAYPRLEGRVKIFRHGIPQRLMDVCPPLFTIGACDVPVSDQEKVCIIDYDVVAVAKIAHPSIKMGSVGGLAREFRPAAPDLPPTNPFSTVAEDEGWMRLRARFGVTDTMYFNTGMLWSHGGTLRRLGRWLDTSLAVFELEGREAVRPWVAEQVGLSLTMAGARVGATPIGHRFHQMNHFVLGSLYEAPPMFVHYCWGSPKPTPHEFATQPPPLNAAAAVVSSWRQSGGRLSE